MDLPPKSLRVDGIIDYYKERLVVEGYKGKKGRYEFSWYTINQRGLWFLYKETKCVGLLNLCINWSKFQCNDMRNLTIRWCQMSLDLMRLVCDVKYITRGSVVVGYAHVSVVDVIQEMKISNTSNGLVLSQSYEKCDNSLVRTLYAKSICIFWEVNKSK